MLYSEVMMLNETFKHVWAHKTRLTLTKPGRLTVMYFCVSGIDCASLYDFFIEYCNCSDIVVFCVFHFISAICGQCTVYRLKLKINY